MKPSSSLTPDGPTLGLNTEASPAPRPHKLMPETFAQHKNTEANLFAQVEAIQQDMNMMQEHHNMISVHDDPQFADPAVWLIFQKVR